MFIFSADTKIYVIDQSENEHLLRNFMSKFLPWLHAGEFSTARLTYLENFGGFSNFLFLYM